jgi:membrane-bound metal-dependent hydrolase YbcI (DUF457 family)
MANFQTHITTGVITSGLLSTVAMAAAVATPNQALALTMAGTLGSILPDIDLEGSRQSRTIFGGFGMFFSLVAVFSYSQFLSIAELCLMWLAIYALIRYGLWRLFNEFTRHRGIFHSLLANMFFAICAVLVFYRVLGMPDVISWLGGAAIFIGAMTHLILDEIYSIDFSGARVRRSFGTALKLFNYPYPMTALLMAAAIVGLYHFTPPTRNMLELTASRDNWLYLRERLLPQGKWFDIKELRMKLAEAAGENPPPPAQTGSIDAEAEGE